MGYSLRQGRRELHHFLFHRKKGLPIVLEKSRIQMHNVIEIIKGNYKMKYK